jgi:hypothetical protein
MVASINVLNSYVNDRYMCSCRKTDDSILEQLHLRASYCHWIQDVAPVPEIF